jgi:hypothetical protein
MLVTSMMSEYLLITRMLFSDINQCLHFIGQSNNVTGVFLDGSIYMTAGYSILNHDVPLITLIHHEYHEYRPGGYKPRSDHGKLIFF